MKHIACALVLSLCASCAPEEKEKPRPSPSPPKPEPARPQPPPPPTDVVAGGGDWDNAVDIKLDDKLTAIWTCKIATGGAPQFYKFAGKPGYRVSLKVSAHETFFSALADGDRKIVDRQQIKSAELGWLHAADQPSDDFHIKLWPMHSNPLSIKCELALLDNTDAGTARDAGATFDKALATDASEVKGWVTGVNHYRGTDNVDVYKIAVEAGKAITVRVTPPPKLRVDVSLLDAKGKRAKQDRSPNNAAIVTLQWTPKESGDAYVRVEGWYEQGGQYAMSIRR